MIITSKASVNDLLEPCFGVYKQKGTGAFCKVFYKELLTRKIKFPLLEYATLQSLKFINVKDQLIFSDHIVAYRSIGGNVIAGIVLQHRLEKHFKQSFEKACEYMQHGDEWYVCDIIGERVFGVALLTQPETTLPLLKKYTKHQSAWVARAVGVAGHYAVKKGLKREFVKPYFELLLTNAATTDFHIKRGIGWAAKTCAKFHPDIVAGYEDEILSAKTGQWFRTKVQIGNSRSNLYKHKYTD